MKIYLSMLQKFVDLPSTDSRELRDLLEDLVSEVKEISEERGQTIFNIETLANRGDHLYPLGIAREIAARNLTAVRQPPLVEITERGATIPVRVATDKCLRYALLEVSLPARWKPPAEVHAIVEPQKERHAIVDLLNFVQLELGQPMHAFDRDAIDGEITIAVNEKAEEIEALDGKRYNVPTGSILIRDRRRTVAVAGVIGCANSMVKPGCRKVLIESATFDPITVRKTARAMGISTEASYVFERGADPEAVLTGLKRVLFLSGGGDGAAGEGSEIVGLSYVAGKETEVRQIEIELALLREQLNLPRLSAQEVGSRLTHLGFTVQAHAGDKSFTVTVPSWRLWDVRNPEDVVEEFGRVHGLNNIKQQLPPLEYELPALNPLEHFQSQVESSIVGAGFCEVITKSFYSAEEVELLGELGVAASDNHVRINNAIESKFSHLKITNVLHLAALAESLHRKGVGSVKIYEYGKIYSREKTDGPYEHEVDLLSLALSGRWSDHDWRKPESRDELIMLFKGVLEGIGSSLKLTLQIGEGMNALLHPGYQATLSSNGQEVGFFGLIHPLLRERLSVKNDLFYAELLPRRLIAAQTAVPFELPSEFPMIKRDITVKYNERGLAAELAHAIMKFKADSLIEVNVVDQFQRPEEPFRRVTYRLTFQSNARTLAHGEVDKTMQSILEDLKTKHQITLA